MVSNTLVRIVSNLWKRIKGNPESLAALLVATIAIAIAISLGEPGKPLIASALVGASASLIMARFVSVLKTPENPIVERPFVIAAKRDLRRVRYVRRNQKLRITYEQHSEGAENSEYVYLRLSSKIVPLNEEEILVPYFKINPPDGLERDKKFENYEINRDSIGLGDKTPITGPSNEVFETRYKIVDKERDVFSDEHRWGCPVEDYEIKMNGNSVFDCAAKEKLGRTLISLKQKTDSVNGDVIFFSDDAALSGQGIEWQFTRKS